LYKDGSTAATDILQASDLNKNPTPEPCDLIANICANGIFSVLRGTVISLHDTKKNMLRRGGDRRRVHRWILTPRIVWKLPQKNCAFGIPL